MAGPGALPKPVSSRARRNKDHTTTSTTLVRQLAEQPPLPDGFMLEGETLPWPARTVEWWEMWGGSAQATQFTAADWDFLMDTATLHARFWLGHVSVAAELRLRVAKFGQTPEDRARLRITFVDADQAEAKHDRTVTQSPKYDDLVATDPAA